jgi:putative nucleotidyltransferase with HDIG domain
MGKERSHWRVRLADFRESVDERDPRRFELVLMACLVVGITILLCSAFVPAIRGFSEGDPAPRTITAGKTVTVVDLEATARAKAQAAENVTPVYVPDSEALPTATSELKAFLTKVEQLRQTDSTVSEALAELGETLADAVSTETLEYLLTSDPESFDLLQNQALLALTKLYGKRITEVEGAKRTLRANVDEWAASAGASQPLADAVYEVVADFVRPNQLVDAEETQILREEAMAQVPPQLLPTIHKGEAVVREGDKVTAQDMLVLQALGLTGTRHGWKVWLGIFLIVLLEAVVFSRLLHRFHKGTKEVTNNMLLALVILMLGGTALARVLIIHPLSAYLIPVAALGMVVSVILNARSALLSVTLASVNVGLLTDFNMRYTLAAFLVGALSLYLVSKVTKRAALLATALVSMFLSAFTIFALEIFAEASVGDALRRSLWGIGNGFLTGFLTILLLLFLESVLNVTTPLRLLELADPAHPLLKKLLQVAPGTYNHSILMGTLAEAAAESIGANPNLARVGAYYHDIGKTTRPEYFVENQIYVGNPHDHLSPNLSKLAITAHVRDGEHLGRLYGLPKPVVDIVKQHHGTSLLAYFYNKAKETSKDEVFEESYRYEGEKPQSKEAAIIMLADGVEAAVHALENPTRRKIQGVIQEIIRQRQQDGQLDESALTQGDLHRISEAFDASLVGLLGHRIRYPDPLPGPGYAAAAHATGGSRSKTNERDTPGGAK